MRAFLAAVVSAFIIAFLAALVLELFQMGNDVANTTTGAVIHSKDEGIEARGW